MILRDRYDGTEVPFEGDREVLLRHLPADARIVRARATVTPVDATGGRDPFAETIFFPGSSGRGGTGDWGATKARPAAPGGWVEVDLHARRTLVGVQGSNLDRVGLLVDLGGVFVRPNRDGTLGPPVDFVEMDSAAGLPSLTVTRFRLITDPPRDPQPDMDVTTVRVRSAPSGVTLALRGQPTLWFHAGELTRPETTPDFGLVLQAYLNDTAEVVDGVFLLPFVLHSESIARLVVEVEIEYLRRVSVMPDGVRDAVLPFDHGGLPRTPGVLEVALPGDARVARGAGRVTGAFEGTRIAFGPTGEATPLGELSVAAGSSPAHPVILPTAVEAVALDLLLTSVTRTARLQLDLRQDLDGKPAGESYLPAPVAFDLERKMAGRPTWVSVPLAVPFQFRPGQERTYWLVLQSLDGEATWSLEEAAPALPGMQLTHDGGFSWRQAALGQSAHLAGFFRLRYQPGIFRMPVDLQVGSGEAARRVSLARFESQGRVDLSFSDLPEVVEAFNQALAAADRCPEVEHLDNGDFEQWIRVGNRLGAVHAIELKEAPDAARIAASPDGRWTYLVSQGAQQSFFEFVDLDLEETGESLSLGSGTPVALAVSPDGARAWVGLSSSTRTGHGSEEEIREEILLIDLRSRQLLGGSLRVPVEGSHQLRAFILSPDGRRLYAALVEGPAASPNARLLAFDTALLEEAALRGDADAGAALLQEEEVALLDAADLAVSPDGSWLYILSSTQGAGKILVADAQRLQVRHDLSFPLELKQQPLAVLRMALTPKGGTAVVVHTDGTALVDLAKREILTSFAHGAGFDGVAVAVGPDGSRAFVAGKRGFRVLDLARRAVVADPLPGFVPPASNIAVTPTGDRVLVAGGNAGLVIPLGDVLPADWTVTAGRVRRFTVAEALGRFTVLGTLPTDLKDMELPGPSAISQVVPVAPCTYELSFQGIATVDDAVAEVLWRGEDRSLLRKDTVPFAAVDSEEFSVTQPRPVFHRARLEAPAAAAQAELRLIAPVGAALVNDVSLRATGGVVQAGDLRGRGLPASWRQVPESAPGFAVVAEGEGSRLRNLGRREVAIVQEVPAVAGRSFALELQGRTVPISALASPTQGGRVELRWLSEGGTESAPPTVFEVLPDAFDVLAATGTAPAGTVRAELRLALTAGTAMDVRRLDLRFPEPATVPVTFVAQAPGELAVLDWELLYDQVPPPRPRVPASGLGPPTPPPLPAGAEGSDDACCPCEPVAAPTPVLSMSRLQPARQAVASGESVTAIRGIGKQRSRRLREARMDSLETLAASSPVTLRRVLPGIPEKAAIDIILAARERLRARR